MLSKSLVMSGNDIFTFVGNLLSSLVGKNWNFLGEGNESEVGSFSLLLPNPFSLFIKQPCSYSVCSFSVVVGENDLGFD